jgi:hypothetical protein
MEQSSPSKALFSGLIYNETGEAVETTYVGSEPHYVILDGDFRRHVASIEIDRQVVSWIQEQAAANKEIVSEQIMGMIGQDDLFTKAMIDSSITNMDQVIQQGLPDDARIMLGMVGFKIVVNVHGEVINLEMPNQELPEGDW